jgi:hypothetical protein
MEPVKVNQNHGMVWYIKKDRQANQVLNDKNGNVYVNLADYRMVISGFLLTFFLVINILTLMWISVG